VAKERSKAGLKEQRRQELERQQRRRMLQIGIPVALAVIAILVLVGLRLFAPGIEGVVDYGEQERDHEDDVVIAESPLPPVGGVHSPTWQNCGIYDQPVESKYALHAMEHGAVWLAYSPELPADDVAALRDIVDGRTYVLMAPYPGLASDVVLTAWGLQLELDSASDDRVDAFIDRYRLGPQTPEPGASCTGGIGTPIGS
jgi:hypothetical protein